MDHARLHLALTAEAISPAAHDLRRRAAYMRRVDRENPPLGDPPQPPVPGPGQSKIDWRSGPMSALGQKRTNADVKIKHASTKNQGFLQDH